MRYISPYNPMSNPVESTMREIGKVLRAQCHTKQISWEIHLPHLEIMLNNTNHSSTESLPVILHEKPH